VYAAYFGLTHRDVAQRAQELLALVELSERARTRIGELSGGMKRRLSIARALINDPEVLILDEPTTGLDPQVRHLIWDRLRGLKRDGKTLILTTHYMEEAERLCHRVAIIDQGRIVALDTLRALQDTLGGGLIIVGLPDEVPDTLGQEIRALSGVRSVDRFDHQIKVKAVNAQQTLPQMINVFNRLDINIHSLEILEPNLEAVFLELTGRRLRD
jgi:ABC-2 type transport system ATP-binding protein